MEIVIINGSPKLGHSTSGLLIKNLISKISNGNKETLTEKQFKKVRNSDMLILAFPLYIDSIPSHLLKLLVELEKRNFATKDIMVYCIVNNGFNILR